MEWNGIIGLVSVATGMGLGFALRTVMWGKRLKRWNTIPMSER